GFSDLNAGLPGISGQVAWGDYDNDGRLDILLAGQVGANQYISQVWQNHNAVTNTPPTAPTGLSATPSGSTVTLNWNTASDAQTVASGLTYNVRVGRTPSGVDVVSPQANPVTGVRQLPQLGNAQKN